MSIAFKTFEVSMICIFLFGETIGTILDVNQVGIVKHYTYLTGKKKCSFFSTNVWGRGYKSNCFLFREGNLALGSQNLIHVTVSKPHD